MEHGTVSKQVSVPAALKNFCQGMCRWDPPCPPSSIHFSRRAGDCQEQNHTNSPTLEGQVVGVRAGHVAVGLGVVCLGPVYTSREDTSQGHTECCTWSALTPTAWVRGRQGKRKPSGPKIKPSSALSVPSSSTKQIPRYLRPVFRLSLFSLYLGPPKLDKATLSLMEALLTLPHTQQSRSVSVKMMMHETTGHMKRYII